MHRPVAVLLLLIFYVDSNGQTVILQSHDLLTANIDQTVSPRDDFYEYANGGGFKRNPQLPSGTNAANEAVLLREKRIADRVAAGKYQLGTDAALVGDLWFTGLNAEELNRQGIEPLRSDLDRIDRISSIRDLLDAVAALNLKSRNGSFLFYGYVWRDEMKSSVLAFKFSQEGTTTMESPSFYTAINKRAEEYRDGLRGYMVRVFSRLSNDSSSAKRSADAVFDIETRLAKARVKDKYQKVTVSDLKQLAPGIDWQRYLQQIGVTGTDALVMLNAGYFRTLSALLSSIPLDVWKDYLRLRLMRVNVAFLDDRTLNEFFEFDRIMTGAGRPRDRWQRVIRQLESRLGQPLARLFLSEYRVAEDKARYRKMAETLRTAFRERIQRSDWLNAVTKQRALLKLDRMKMTIGFPDKWANFSTMRLKRDAYALNIMRANEWLTREEIKQVGKAVDRAVTGLWWKMRSDAGEYDPTNNELYYSATFFPSVSGIPVASEDAELYASLRSLGHEISHGFDSNGRNVDEMGNRVDWWTAADAAEFNKRSQLLVDQYSSFVPIEGLHIDGKLTLAENMADLTGALIVLDAFEKSEQFKKGQSIGGFTPMQRFFIALAHSATRQTPQTIAAMAQGGDHSPARERVNGVLMNIPEFYEAFGVKLGDGMFLPESKRARIW
jgi:putative endopeptidase